MFKKLLIGVVLVVVVFFIINSRKEESSVQPESKGEAVGMPVPTEDSKDVPEMIVTDTTGATSGEEKALVHYFTKKNLIACKAETVALERTIDPKFGVPEVGALVELVKPLSKEEEAEYGSAILRGTRFLSLKIDSKGTATADFSSLLDKEITDCVKVQRQAQIEKTLEAYPGVKSVVITVNGRAW